MSDRDSFTPAYFERLYQQDPDPWRFATSDYERSKYSATLDALAGLNIENAFEVGCSIGILTRQLAPRCGTLLSVDVSEIAVANARRNCEDVGGNLVIKQMLIPREWPAQSFDLIVLSEVLYFLSPADIRLTARRSMESLSQKGHVLLVNWTGATNYPCGGDEATNIYRSECGEKLFSVLLRREAEYRLDLLTRV